MLTWIEDEHINRCDLAVTKSTYKLRFMSALNMENDGASSERARITPATILKELLSPGAVMGSAIIHDTSSNSTSNSGVSQVALAAKNHTTSTLMSDPETTDIDPATLGVAKNTALSDMTNTPISRDGDDDDPGFQAFREEVQRKDEAKRVKAGGKQSQRFTKQKVWRQQLKRTQQYLRLCTPPNALAELAGSPDPSNLPTNQSSHLPNQVNLGTLSNGYSTPVMFISVDVEAFEFDQKRITEIGVSTLETVDLYGIPPGNHGKDWAAKINARHFRILEHGHLLNKVHVEGCPDKFNFGQSEWIHARDVKSTLERCFVPSIPPLWALGTFTQQPCKVVLVAHNAAADIKYLAELGFNVTEKISDCIDTEDIYRVVRREIHSCALSTLLLQYRIAASHLHNAGNDANYTLRVMVAIALDDFQNKKTKEYWEVEKSKRIQVAIKEAEAKACAEFEGWSSCEDDEIAAPPVMAYNPNRRVEKASNSTKGPRNSNMVKPTERFRPKQRPAYRSQLDGALDEIAVQDNPNFQDVCQQPLPPPHIPTNPSSNNVTYNGKHNEIPGTSGDQERGRNRRHRGQGQAQNGSGGRGRGRGQPQDGISGQFQVQIRARGRGEGRGQVRGQARGQV